MNIKFLCEFAHGDDLIQFELFSTDISRPEMICISEALICMINDDGDSDV